MFHGHKTCPIANGRVPWPWDTSYGLPACFIAVGWAGGRTSGRAGARTAARAGERTGERVGGRHGSKQITSTKVVSAIRSLSL